MVRAFVAMQIPTVIREQLARAQTDLKKELCDVSWTRPEAMHLTLHFFGNIELARLPELLTALALAAASHAKLTLAVRGVGQFGQRVIWAGLEGDVEELQALARTVRSAVARLGYAVEKREFNPHVTLGRMRAPARGVGTKLARWRDAQFGLFTASEVELIRSELSPQGSRYTVLGQFPLASPVGSTDR